MATARPFNYNTGASIAGTEQVGSLAVGTPSSGFAGRTWWNGPDEDLGYVIAESVPLNTQPTPVSGVLASVGFFRSPLKTDASFIGLANVIAGAGGPFASGDAAKTWLNANGYWTNYSSGFTYANFASTAGLVLVGSATNPSNTINVMPNSAGSGNVYRTTTAQYNKSFSVTWAMLLDGGTSTPADGFTLQWTTTNNTAGGAGGQCGLIAASSTINALQFKTYTSNNLTWLKANSSQGSQVSQNWYGQFYYWLDYDFAASTMSLYYSASNTKPGSANKVMTGFTFDSGSYYIGFGAACGGSLENHKLQAWSLTF